MTAAMNMVDQAASLVRRTRAGDQNAEATIYQIGQYARAGHSTARQAAMFVKQYISENPPAPYALGDGPPAVMDTTAPGILPQAPTRISGEMRKPQLQRGMLRGLSSPEDFAMCVLNACQHRNGLQAAAAVLARGPLLTNPVVAGIAQNNFGHERSKRAFFHGVQFSGEDEWQALAPALEPNMRRCLAIGQCIGRARALQAVRMPRSRIGAYNAVVGWEFGE